MKNKDKSNKAKDGTKKAAKKLDNQEKVNGMILYAMKNARLETLTGLRDMVARGGVLDVPTLNAMIDEIQGEEVVTVVSG